MFAFLVFFFSFQPAFAESLQTIFTSDNTPISRIYVGDAGSDDLLITTEDKRVLRVASASGQVLGNYDDRCDFEAEVEWGGEVAWAFPFLVSLGRTCFLNVSTGALERVGDNVVPTNAFSAAFLTASNGVHHFVINSKPWETDGFIHLKSIDSRNLSVSFRTLITDVPSFSGAMAVSLDKKALLYNEATGGFSNRLHRLSMSELLELIDTGTQARFADIAQFRFEYPGMSFWMSVGQGFMMLGTDRAPYLISDDGKVKKLPATQGCAPIGLARDRVLYQCGNKSIQTGAI